MGVCEIPQMREEHGEVGRRVSKGGTHKHALLMVPSTPRSLHGGQVVVSNGLNLHWIFAGGEQTQGHGWEDRGAPGRGDQDGEE